MEGPSAASGNSGELCLLFPRLPHLFPQVKEATLRKERKTLSIDAPRRLIWSVMSPTLETGAVTNPAPTVISHSYKAIIEFLAERHCAEYPDDAIVSDAHLAILYRLPLSGTVASASRRPSALRWRRTATPVRKEEQSLGRARLQTKSLRVIDGDCELSC